MNILSLPNKARFCRYAFLFLALGLFCALRLTAQTNFATLISDGAWTWYNDPRALFHNGKLYFGYVRAADSKTTLSAFDLSTGQTTNLWVSGFTQFDDHNNPGLLVKSDDTFLAIYSRHGSDLYFSYRTSTGTNPATSAGWNAELSIANSGASMTYANPFQLRDESGKIYNFCRNLNFNPTVYTSTNGGSNWSSPQLFIQTGAGSIRPYVKYASDYTNRIDFLYTDGHPRNENNSLYHLYYSSNAFFQTDGTLVKDFSSLPLLHDIGERGSVIYQYSEADTADPNDHIPAGRAWNWETAYQSNGVPVCIFTVQNDFAPVGQADPDWQDDRIYYYYARWTGSVWQKRFIAHAGRPLYSAEDDYAGGIAIDPIEPNVVYISSNAEDPFNLTETTNVMLRANNRYEIWRGVTSDGGLTFAWTQITTNSTVDNLRPYVPRRHGGEPCVIWFRGSYASYTSYSASIVGLFTTQVPTNATPTNATLSINYLDATSGPGGNTTLANGSTFSPPLNSTTGADNNWEQRTVFASSGNVFEAGGESSENAPELRTTITGLIPNASYALYVFFWDATGSGENWNIRAGFSSAPGVNPLFSASDSAGALGATPAVLANTMTYTTAPTLFAEGNRLLLAAALGTNAADATGTIRLFIDDKPTSAGAANRTWYDGVGWMLNTASYPTNLSYQLNGNSFAVSWPATHLGWILQSQTNSSGLSTNWYDIPSSGSQTQTVISVSLSIGTSFFRLRHP